MNRNYAVWWFKNWHKFDKEYREGINSAIENNDFNYTCK